jgi:hypothetical protein
LQRDTRAIRVPSRGALQSRGALCVKWAARRPI